MAKIKIKAGHLFSQNRSRGLKAKKQGDTFESLIEKRAKAEGLRIKKWPNGGRMVSKHKFIRIKSPMDFMLFKGPHDAFFDAKSTTKDRFPYSSIDRHQLKHILDFANEGRTAGYLVHFITLEIITWFPSGTLQELKPRQSLKTSHGIKINRLSDLLYF